MAQPFMTPPFDPRIRLTDANLQQTRPQFKPPIGGPQRQLAQPQAFQAAAQQQPVLQTTQQAQALQAPQQATPQFGLSGAESALQGSLQGGLGAISQGTNQALGTLQFGNQLAQNQLSQGQQALGGNFNAQAQQAQAQQAQALNANVVNVDPLTGQPLFQQAAQGVGQFVGAGVGAQQRQSALSGAQGQQAFDQAFLNDPGQAFLRQQGLDAVANQAAASGGLGSGQFQKELTQFGQGNAAQNIQQQIQNLGALSQQGLQAAGQQGQFLSQAGQQQANLAAQNAQLGTNVNLQNAQLGTNVNLQNAQLGTQAGLQNAQLGTNVNLQNAGRGLQAAQSQAQLFGQGAGISANLAGQGAGFQQQGGLTAANLFGGTGQQVAQGRLQAGRDIAGQVGASTSALSALQNQQGTGLSDILGGGAQSQAQLQQLFGQLNAQQQQQLMNQLGNISLGQGSQLATGAGQIGQAQAGGITGQAGQQQQTALQLATLLSDERLKDNIVKVGVKNGHNIYTWIWNNLMPIKSEIGKSSTGVIAQEVEKIKPEAISKHESGYKQVNYALIGVL